MTLVENQELGEEPLAILTFQLLESAYCCKISEIFEIGDILTLGFPLVNDLFGVGYNPYSIQREEFQILFDAISTASGLALTSGSNCIKYAFEASIRPKSKCLGLPCVFIRCHAKLPPLHIFFFFTF